MLAATKIIRTTLPVAKVAFTTPPTKMPLFRSQPVVRYFANDSKEFFTRATTPSMKMPLLRSQPVVRYFANDSKESFSRTARRRRTLKEIVMQPTQGTPFAIGKAAVAGGSVVGIGALCFYGLGLANTPGAIDKSMLWPEHVKERIKSTYTYLGSSLVITGASAVAFFRSPTMIRLMSSNTLLATAGTMALVIGTGMVARSITYQPGFGAKQLAWIVHTGVIGAVIAPMCFIAGPLAIRAAWYTAGIVGGLSAIAVCAPSDKFLSLAGPLSMGLGVVFVSSLGSMFLSPTTALGAGLYSISLYGGLLLFSGFLLYDTQRIIKSAESYPAYAVYDPINSSMSVYMDTINIFIRILVMLMGSERKRR